MNKFYIYRKLLNISMEDAAKMIKVTKQTISNIEKGIHLKPSLCDYYEIKLKEYFYQNKEKILENHIKLHKEIDEIDSLYFNLNKGE